MGGIKHETMVEKLQRLNRILCSHASDLFRTIFYQNFHFIGSKMVYHEYNIPREQKTKRRWFIC